MDFSPHEDLKQNEHERAILYLYREWEREAPLFCLYKDYIAAMMQYDDKACIYNIYVYMINRKI